MVQNNDRAELVDALKCLRDNDIAHLPQNQKDILLNANEEALIQAYYDMDGEFSCSKCCNLDNPYLSIPLGLCCCATSVAMVGGLGVGIYQLAELGYGIHDFAFFGLLVASELPVLPAKCAVDLITKKSKVQDEEPKIQQAHTTEDMRLEDINSINNVSILADNIFLRYLKYVCSLHTYTATDKKYIKGLIQQLCSAKKMRHSNNLYANHHLSNSGNIHIQ